MARRARTTGGAAGIVRILGNLRDRRTTWPRWAHGLTSRWVVIPVTIVSLFVVAFVSYGAYTRSRPTIHARGNPEFGVPPEPSPTGTGGTASPAASPTATTAATGPPAVSSPGAPAGQAPPASAPAVALPREGTYRLSVDGSEQVRFGPLSPCNRSFPSQASLVVRRSAGEGATSFDFDIQIFPGRDDMHDERHIYRYEPEGVFLDYEDATVTCAGIKQQTVITFSPPQQKVRLPLKVGASWSGTGGNEKRTESYQARVLRPETLTVDGRSVNTFVIETTIEMTGSENGSRLQRWWYAPALAVPVRWYEEISASRMGATYSSRGTFRVVEFP